MIRYTESLSEIEPRRRSESLLTEAAKARRYHCPGEGRRHRVYDEPAQLSLIRIRLPYDYVPY